MPLVVAGWSLILAGRFLLLVGLPQCAQHPPQSRQRLPPYLFHGDHCLAGLGRLCLHHSGCGSGLQGDDADAVGNRVVHLAGDAKPFGGDRLGGGPGVQLRGVGTGLVHRVADEPGDDDRQGDKRFGGGAGFPSRCPPQDEESGEHAQRPGGRDDRGAPGPGGRDVAEADIHPQKLQGQNFVLPPGHRRDDRADDHQTVRHRRLTAQQRAAGQDHQEGKGEQRLGRQRVKAVPGIAEGILMPRRHQDVLDNGLHCCHDPHQRRPQARRYALEQRQRQRRGGGHAGIVSPYPQRDIGLQSYNQGRHPRPAIVSTGPTTCGGAQRHRGRRDRSQRTHEAIRRHDSRQ